MCVPPDNFATLLWSSLQIWIYLSISSGYWLLSKGIVKNH